jgi:hypothetical protein
VPLPQSLGIQFQGSYTGDETGHATCQAARQDSGSKAAANEHVPYATPHFRSGKSLWAALVMRASNDANATQPDLPTIVKRLQQLQRTAETAGRVEPLLRTIKQLRCISRYVRSAAPFAELSDDEMLNVARSIVMVKTEAGERVVAEGSVGSAFFIVLAGEFSVFQQAVTESPYHQCAL